MKILSKFWVIFLVLFCLTGCMETKSTDEAGNETTEFKVGETANVNKTKITINSVKKINQECAWEYSGKCQSYTKPENDYFLLLDLTIENTANEELAVSSIMSFELKDASSEKAEQAFGLNAVKSSLDGSVMANDKLKGQIAYDVKDSEYYNFYYQDSLLDDSIKFTINKDDIN